MEVVRFTDQAGMHSEEHSRHIKYPRYIFRKLLSLDLLRQYVPPPAFFIDLGCGAGDFGITLGQRGYRGVLVDSSDDAERYSQVAIADAYLSGQVIFRRQDFFTLQPPEPVNVVIAFEVLEHLLDDAALVRQMHNLLVPNGFSLISVPAHQRLWTQTDVVAGHYRRYERAQLNDLFMRNGFRVVKLWSYGFPALNILKVARDYVFRRKAQLATSQSMEERTAGSGLHEFHLPGRRLISNEGFWRPMITASRAFHATDWSEAYLCFAQRM